MVNLPPINIAARISDSNLTTIRPYAPSATLVNDITHTKLKLSFSNEKKEVYGTAELTVKPYFHNVKELILDAKYFDINRVALVDGDDMTDLSFKYDTLKLTINLDRTYTKDETYTVFIDYTAHPHDTKDPETEKGLFFVDVIDGENDLSYQLWTQGETQLNSSWFPASDIPNEKFTQEIYLTVDKKFKTLSNGLLVFSAENEDGTRTDYWKQSLPHSAYLAVIVVGDYKVVKDDWKGMEVSYYVEPRYEQYARDIFGKTPKMIEFYSNVLNYPYPWEKYSQILVRDFDVAYAMENTTAVTNHADFQLTRRELLDDDSEATIAHELFHHWFGDLLTAESWPNLPLNESFATYGEVMWYEHAYGSDRGAYHLNTDLNSYLYQSASEQHDLIWFGMPDRGDMFDSHSYSKGGCILHMLRNYLGDKAFYGGLSYYLKQNEFQSVEAHQLRKAFEKISGEDLNWFFNQWFFSQGHPELKILYSYDEVKKKQIVTIDQKQDLLETPLYKLPIQIDVYYNGKVDSFQVVLDSVRQTFSFDIPTKPDLVNVDADKMLLCEKIDIKTKNELIFQFNHAPRYMDKKEALDALNKDYTYDEEANIVFLKALSHPFWNIRLLGIEYLNDTVLDASKDLKGIMTNLAKNDTKSQVRGDALDHLFNFYKDDPTIVQVQEDAINDSSYYVLTTGLLNLLLLNEDKGRAYAIKFEKEASSDILLVLSDFYSDNGTAEDHSFFPSSLTNIDHYYKWQFIDNYCAYLLEQKNDSLIELSLPLLGNFAQNESDWYDRLTGLVALKELQWYYDDKIKTFSGTSEERVTCVYNGKKIKEKVKEILKEEKEDKVKDRLETYISVEVDEEVFD